MTKRFLATTVAGLSVLSACSSSMLSSNDDQIAADLREMKARVIELQKQAAMTEVELDRLRQQVANLEGQVRDAQTPEGRETVGSVEQDSPPSSPEWPAAAGFTVEEVEESDLASAATTESPEAVGSSASPPGMAASPEVTPEGRLVPPPTPVSEEPTPEPAFQPVDSAAQALYDRGYTLYHQGRYLDAEASFQRFLQAYPRTDLSDNAQFWIGESRFARGDLTGALAAFRETLQRYPEGNKIPDALIKEGDCLAGLGDRDGARGRYEEVVRRFPGSAAAVMAQERVRELN